jgi:hypothetical protein
MALNWHNPQLASGIIRGRSRSSCRTSGDQVAGVRLAPRLRPLRSDEFRLHCGPWDSFRWISLSGPWLSG